MLDFPRERYRALLESLVRQQEDQRGERWIMDFGMNDVSEAFEQGDRPEWERFADPWRFYDPEEIENRQRRWEKEDARHGDDYSDDFLGEDRFPFAEPYVREQPKVGRNDPCPAAVAKYKKCCLQ